MSAISCENKFYKPYHVFAVWTTILRAVKYTILYRATYWTWTVPYVTFYRVEKNHTAYDCNF
jgi:hypothetical protein